MRVGSRDGPPDGRCRLGRGWRGAARWAGGAARRRRRAPCSLARSTGGRDFVRWQRAFLRRVGSGRTGSDVRRCAGLVTAGLAIAGVAIAAILLVARAADGPGAGLAHGPATAPAAQPAAEEPREPHSAGPTESATAASSAPPTTSDSSPAQQTAPPAPSPAPDPDPIASEPLETLIVSSPPDTATPGVTREEIAPASDPKGSSELTPPAPKPPRDPPATAAARSAHGEASGGRLRREPQRGSTRGRTAIGP